MKVAIAILAVMVALLIGCVVSIVVRIMMLVDKFNLAIYEVEREQKRVDHVLTWLRKIVKDNNLA